MALTIGEVLSHLQDDFPDISISKIRFLESQGLLNPERTPSGYRKFTDEDVERLRWILVQQRDHFLPLKVIKERLLNVEPGQTILDFGDDGSSRASAINALMEDPAPAPTPASAKKSAHPTKGQPKKEIPNDSQFRLADVMEQTGVTKKQIDELESFSLISPQDLEGEKYYSADDVVLVRLAEAFARYGIEPRHLRMYRNAAEREAQMFQQIITPLLLQRKAAARDQAVEILEDLADLADELRAVMVKSALRDALGKI